MSPSWLSLVNTLCIVTGLALSCALSWRTVGVRSPTEMRENDARMRASTRSTLDLLSARWVGFDMTVNDNVISGAALLLFAVAAGGHRRAGAASADAVQFHTPPGWSVPPISAGLTVPAGR